MGDDQFEKGDRIRVTFETTYVGREEDRWLDTGCASIKLPNVESLLVEKVEPPVVTFKPGDVVRVKGYTGLKYLLTDDGYVALPSGRHFATGPAEFTSEDYELVDLAEVPF